MKEELQAYLRATFGVQDINQDNSLWAPVQLYFELGGELENGTPERVVQATSRATTLFHEAFEDATAEIWVLIYEYGGESVYGPTAEYLYRQFPSTAFASFYNQPEMLDLGWGTEDTNGNREVDLVAGRLIIGKLPVQQISVGNILAAIVNTEMGFTPALNERVYFIDPRANRIFFMFDDRGCYVASNTADSLRELYQHRKSWIPEYSHSEMAAQFS